jgi:hypothetical protein
MLFLFLPATKRAINASQIAAIDEVTATVPDPSKKGGEAKVPGVSVTMIAAPIVDDGEEDGDLVPYFDTYAGDDASVLLAFRDHHLIRQLVHGNGENQGVTELPLPASAVALDDFSESADSPEKEAA